MNKRKEQSQLAKGIGIFIGIMLFLMTVNTCNGQDPCEPIGYHPYFTPYKVELRKQAAKARAKVNESGQLKREIYVNSADTVKTIYLKRWTLREWKRYYRKHKNDEGFKAFLKWYKNKEQ